MAVAYKTGQMYKNLAVLETLVRVTSQCCDVIPEYSLSNS